MNDVPYDRVMASYARCLVNPAFFNRFYGIFTASHPAILPMFAKTDMAKQQHLLRHGIMSALRYAESRDNLMARTCIDRIRESHSRKQYAISPELYPFWLNSLIQAVHETDPEFNPTIEEEWRQVLQPVVDYIGSGY